MAILIYPNKLGHLPLIRGA